VYSDGDILGYLAFGFGAGVYFFVTGFRIFRKYRVLADTPVAPIRSIAMGLVEIHGKAKGMELIPSPVSHTPCLFYKVDIERWERSQKGGGHWSHYRTDTDGVRFYLEDATGKVLVDAHGAEFDLIQSARREVGTGRRSGRSWWALFTGSGDPTLATGPGVPGTPSGGALPPTPPREDELSAYIARGPQTRAGPLGVNRLPARLTWNPAFWFGRGGLSDHCYRLTEYCILPEHWYDVTGTCTENPNPKDEQDRNLIAKGENEPTFVISWRSETGIEKKLRRQAALYILGGAALAIVCMAILLAHLGWL
jgi:hypothetical protein